MAFVRSFIGALLSLVLLTDSAFAQSWNGPNPTNRTYMFGHSVENFNFAITEVCLPFLLQSADADVWRRRQGVAPFPAGGPFQGLSAYLIGGSGGAIVGVGNRLGSRECTIKGDSAEPQVYVSSIQEILQTLGYSRIANEVLPPSEIGERVVYCSPPQGPQIVAVVTLASEGRSRGDTILTFLELQERDARCVVADVSGAEPQ